VFFIVFLLNLLVAGERRIEHAIEQSDPTVVDIYEEAGHVREALTAFSFQNVNLAPN
jgi:hypothetical protein